MKKGLKVVLEGTFEGTKDRFKVEPSELRITKLVRRVFKNKRNKS